MGAGVDPHLYKPTESDIAAMNAAQLVVYSGLNLEGQFDAVFAALGERQIRTYALATKVDAEGLTLQERVAEGSVAVTDPHFWFDPRNWQLVTTELAAVLAETDPDNADFYTANAEAYVAQLEALYTWGVEAMAAVPEAQRTLVTSHDAFQYFGDAFGWQVRGLQGISTASETSVADVQALAQFVVQQKIPVMFVESSVPPNTIRAVQEAVRAAGGDIRLGVRELYSDAMDAPDTYGGTYIGMIATNVITILQSFGVEVPAWPEGLEPVPSAELNAGR
jgi:manganese/zinc/iron transport system substrate-binding protein